MRNTLGPDKPQNIEGFYFWGDGISAFQPCYSRRILAWRQQRKPGYHEKIIITSRKPKKNTLISMLPFDRGKHRAPGADRQSITYDETP